MSAVAGAVAEPADDEAAYALHDAAEKRACIDRKYGSGGIMRAV